MNKVLLLVASHLLALSACASDLPPAPASPQKVDLGTVVETESVQPVNGISSAGQPDEASLKVFADNGYVAVIDLRTDGEDRGLDEKAVVEGLGMTYVSMPIGRDGITFDNASALDKLLSAYDEPVLVHCGSGNRVGALLALRARQQGANDEAAIEIGKQGGLTRLEPTVREVLREN